ncbi:chromosomal passenger protein [Angomonas deanei]|nr:chromosomal passenger protein [Angomonas deanei]EPY42463.1 chromosomal passenger protein [Angomonas deanei]|eukprot:EPY39837.1 chromosomal passenger protein [Angomonas deanei]
MTLPSLHSHTPEINGRGWSGRVMCRRMISSSPTAAQRWRRLRRYGVPHRRGWTRTFSLSKTPVNSRSREFSAPTRTHCDRCKVCGMPAVTGRRIHSRRTKKICTRRRWGTIKMASDRVNAK